MRLHKNGFDAGKCTYHVFCSHDESKCPFMLNNPNPKILTIRKGILGYTFLDCSQETIQTMSLIDNVFFVEVFEAVVSELKNDLYVCSTKPYNYPSTEIDHQNKLSEMVVSENELATDISCEVKCLQPRNLKLACDTKR